MGRMILGIVVGYIVMAVWVMATLSLAWKLLGADFASQTGTTQVTLGWIAVNLPLSFIGAYIGGSFAMRVGKERGVAAARGLAIAILLIGLGTAIAYLVGDSQPVPTAAVDGMTPHPDSLTTFDASTEAIQPVWYNFIIPFIGAAGVMLGGRRRPSE